MHYQTASKQAQEIDANSVRSQFPILGAAPGEERVVYLDSAASSQKPEAVLGAMEHYYRLDYANVHRGVYKLADRSTEAYERARRQVAAFFGVEDEEEIIFVRNATEAINLAAASWGAANLGPGDVVVTSVMEHHSNLIPWQLICERTGAGLEFVGIDAEGKLKLDDLDRLLAAGNVKLVATLHVSNMLGTINPVETIIEKAHAAGARVLIDGAQSAPHMPINLAALDADFFACSGHKMCGPMGSGMLWGRRELLESMPPYMGGGQMIRSVELRHSTWADIPQKFEAGTPSVADAVGFGAACDYLSGLSMSAVHDHERQITRYAYEQLKELPAVTIYGPDWDERGGVISFNLGRVHPHDIATILDGENVAVRAGHHCTQPLHRQLGIDASVRASFYVYNTIEDVDRLVAGIDRVREIFDQETAV
ncbi:MAG: SufS family cysteine desulfurase [Thermomicrobiales bacterium]